MTARRVNPLSPAPPAGAYAQWLAARAQPASSPRPPR